MGNDPVDADHFVEWLGQSLDGVLLHSGAAGWEDWTGSIGWLAERWRPSGRKVFWSIPLIPTGANLEAAARGDYDQRYRTAARTLANSDPSDLIDVRTGWEFNGSWMPWAAQGRDAVFIQAFRRFVTLFREECPRFRFEWTPNIGALGMNPAAAYPGDGYVDIIGMDFYYDPKWHSLDPEQAWAYMVNQPYGLAWHQDFARSHGKQTAYSEWGVTTDTAGAYIARAFDWFRTHEVLYQSYWNSDAAFAGQLSNGRLPNAAAAFRAAWASAARTLAR